MPDLTTLITTALTTALTADNGRHAVLMVSDGPLRQTVLALRQGVRLAEHNSPPAASIYVLHGSLRVTGEEERTLRAGDLEALTHHRHAVEALEDCAFLLTTVTSVPGTTSHTGELPVVDPAEL